MCLFGVLGSIFQDGVRSTKGLFGSNTCERKKQRNGIGQGKSTDYDIDQLKFLPVLWGALSQKSSCGVVLHLAKMSRPLYHALFFFF